MQTALNYKHRNSQFDCMTYIVKTKNNGKLIKMSYVMYYFRTCSNGYGQIYTTLNTGER